MDYLDLCRLESSSEADRSAFLRDHCHVAPSPDSLEVLRKEIASRKKSIQSLSCRSRSRKPPHAYQWRIAEYLRAHRGLLVFHTVGSGKTLTAILASQCYLDQFPNHRVVVITPAGLRDNFVKEMFQGFGNLLHRNKYVFYSFEKFARDSRAAKTEKDRDMLCRNSLLIIDEVHNLRTMPGIYASSGKEKGIRTKEILDCAERAHRVLILSGTPIINDVSDLLVYYNMIRDTGSPPLLSTKALLDNDMEVWKCKLSFHSPPPNHQDFPSKEVHDIYIDMTPEFEKRYDKMVEYITSSSFNQKQKHSSWRDPHKMAAFHNALRRATNRLESVPGESPKLQYLISELEKHASGKTQKQKQKCIVFSNFLDSGNRLLERDLLAKNIPAGYIHGSMPLAERTRLVQRYNDGDLHILLLSRAGGEGLDLKETNRVYLMEPAWNQAFLDQVIGRAVRYKSHREKGAVVHVFSLYLVKPSDRKFFPEIQKYIRDSSSHSDPKSESKSLENPVNIANNSIDIVMKVFIEHKQAILDRTLALLKSCSIERQSSCPG